MFSGGGTASYGWPCCPLPAGISVIVGDAARALAAQNSIDRMSAPTSETLRTPIGLRLRRVMTPPVIDSLVRECVALPDQFAPGTVALPYHLRHGYMGRLGPG